jgi:hypothetical protein
MRRQIAFTVDEAKAYIIESVKEWDVPGHPDKIISMADYAYNRRVKKAAAVSPVKTMKDMQMNIKDLKRVIKRNTDNAIASTNLEKSLEATINIYDKLVTEHGEPEAKPKKPE